MKPDKLQTVEETNRLNERNKTFNKNKEKRNSTNYKNLWDKKQTACVHAKLLKMTKSDLKFGELSYKWTQQFSLGPITEALRWPKTCMAATFLGAIKIWVSSKN